MAYAVYHTEKGKTGTGGIGQHIDRAETAKHTFKHSDPNRRELNQNYEINRYCKMPLSQAVNERIKDGYNGKRKIRTDAVRFQTHILTGSNERMKELEKDQDKFNAWIKQNYEFIKQEFGADNIVRFVLHMDETTPHIHAVTVPLTEDGRLSAREIMGNKKDYQARQDRYAEMMQPFGLKRGKKRSGIKHESAKEFYARMKTANEVNADDLKADRKVLGVKVGINKDKTIENLENAVKAQRTALKMEQLKTKKAEKDSGDIYKRLQGMEKGRTEARENLVEIATNPEKRQRFQMGMLQQIVNRITKTPQWKRGELDRERAERFLLESMKELNPQDPKKTLDELTHGNTEKLFLDMQKHQDKIREAREQEKGRNRGFGFSR